MKQMIIGIVAMCSITAFAESGPFQGKKYSFCKKQKIASDGYSLACKGSKDYNNVISATKKIKRQIPFNTFGVTDAETGFKIIPDADTNHIYRFENALLNPYGGVVGYMSVDGYQNSEIDYRIQITTRYNVNGELVLASIKN